MPLTEEQIALIGEILEKDEPSLVRGFVTQSEATVNKLKEEVELYKSIYGELASRGVQSLYELKSMYDAMYPSKAPFLLDLGWTFPVKSVRLEEQDIIERVFCLADTEAQATILTLVTPDKFIAGGEPYNTIAFSVDAVLEDDTVVADLAYTVNEDDVTYGFIFLDVVNWMGYMKVDYVSGKRIKYLRVSFCYGAEVTESPLAMLGDFTSDYGSYDNYLNLSNVICSYKDSDAIGEFADEVDVVYLPSTGGEIRLTQDQYYFTAGDGQRQLGLVTTAASPWYREDYTITRNFRVRYLKMYSYDDVAFPLFGGRCSLDNVPTETFPIEIMNATSDLQDGAFSTSLSILEAYSSRDQHEFGISGEAAVYSQYIDVGEPVTVTGTSNNIDGIYTVKSVRNEIPNVIIVEVNEDIAAEPSNGLLTFVSLEQEDYALDYSTGDIRLPDTREFYWNKVYFGESEELYRLYAIKANYYYINADDFKIEDWSIQEAHNAPISECTASTGGHFAISLTAHVRSALLDPSVIYRPPWTDAQFKDSYSINLNPSKSDNEKRLLVFPGAYAQHLEPGTTFDIINSFIGDNDGTYTVEESYHVGSYTYVVSVEPIPDKIIFGAITFTATTFEQPYMVLHYDYPLANGEKETRTWFFEMYDDFNAMSSSGGYATILYKGTFYPQGVETFPGSNVIMTRDQIATEINNYALGTTDGETESTAARVVFVNEDNMTYPTDYSKQFVADYTTLKESGQFEDVLASLEGFVGFQDVLYNAIYGYNKKLSNLTQIQGVMTERADTLEKRDAILGTLI